MIRIVKKHKRKRVFIHIGFMKTGTTAIQRMLWENRSYFSNNDFYIPELNSTASNYLGFSMLNEIPPKIHVNLGLSEAELYDKLLREIKKSKSKNVIISSEAYSLIATDAFIGPEAPRKLLSYFNKENFDVKIVAFVRRQDEYLESQYNQHIKTHNFWNFYHEDIETFFKEKEELFDFRKLLITWSDVFGQENLKVACFDKNRDIRLSFLDLVGFEDSAKLILKSNPENEKLGLKALEFMRIANKYDIKKDSVAQNQELVRIITNTLGDKEVEGELLSTDKKKYILETFSASNKELSNLYLNGDTSWYENPVIGVNDENSIATVSKEESIEIAVAIWNYYQKTIGKS